MNGSERREPSNFRKPRGERECTMEIFGTGTNRGDGIPRSTTPTTQLDRQRPQPQLSYVADPSNPGDVRAASAGRAGMTVGFSQVRQGPDIVTLDRAAQQRY